MLPSVQKVGIIKKIDTHTYITYIQRILHITLDSIILFISLILNKKLQIYPKVLLTLDFLT